MYSFLHVRHLRRIINENFSKDPDHYLISTRIIKPIFCLKFHVTIFTLADMISVAYLYPNDLRKHIISPLPFPSERGNQQDHNSKGPEINRPFAPDTNANFATSVRGCFSPILYQCHITRRFDKRTFST
ncbi:hypothetical protein NPIL_234611 [Nephila pilipes]|uniref:Uncharacterized protein n=1 Tax=Nephila pilipes TaxID=299642 RepID=A0A8X6UHN0_NEPPI|nr:hypothetical protein NPIL_234611 [Nephila pilipes]